MPPEPTVPPAHGATQPAGREEELPRPQFILASVKDFAVFTLDPAGVVTSWNPGAEEVFGYPAAEIVGGDGAMLWTPEDQARGGPAEERALALRDGMAEDKRSHQRKDGSRFFANGTMRPLLDEAGNLVGFTKVCRDASAEHAAQEALTAARAQIATALEAERARLAGLFESSPSFMAVLRGPEHVFELANDQYYRLVGRRELIGKAVREALPEIAGQGVFELLDRVYQTGERFVGKGTRILVQPEPEPGSSERYLDFVYQPTRDNQGVVSGILVHGVDATEREKAEITSQRLTAIIDSSDDAIVGKDLRSVVTSWNAGAQRIFGYSAAEMIGNSIHVLIPPDRHGEEDEILARISRGERVDHLETIRVAKGGRLLDVSVTVSPIRDSTGKVIGASKVARDVTERRQAEAKLRASEQRFRQLWATTTDAIVIMDAQQQVEYANPALQRLFGFAPEELIARGMNLIIPERLRAAHRHGVARYLATGERKLDWRSTEIVGLHQDGHEFPIEISFSQFQEDGRDLFAAFMRDITERKQAQEALQGSEARFREMADSERVARTEAEHASRMKDEFLATLSHELRTPLNAILGWSQVLRDAPGPEDVAQGVAVIERNARAQKTIIEDLLDMSRIISGKVRLDVQRIDLAPVVEAAIESIRPAADAKGVRLQAVLDPLARPVSGDPNRLQQIFWNLLSNAVKFTSRGGRVQVLLERVNSHLEVSVIDTGEGISPDFLPHVFDRFRQADATTTRRHGGLGLGLAIVKQLVELHGGTARVKSGGEGQGTTFTVALPLTVLHPEAATETERRHPQAADLSGLEIDPSLQLNGVRVLVVDDEADSRELVRRLLEGCAATVRTAGSAAEAMALIQAEVPDVLVSDIGMPEQDGYALIRQVRALDGTKGGNVPAMALTAYARAEDRMRVIRAGFQMHVAKPVEGAELLTMVASLAGRNPVD